MLVTKVGRRGQITLPRLVRQWLKIDQSDRILFVRRGEEIVLQPLSHTLLDLRGIISVDGPQDFNTIRQNVIQARPGRSREYRYRLYF